MPFQEDVLPLKREFERIAAMDKIKTYRRLAKNFAQVVSLATMYKFEHPMVGQKFQTVYAEINNFFNEYKQSIVLAKSVDMLLINGEKIEPEDKLMIKFIEDFVALDVGSIELEIGLASAELEIFIHIMHRAEQIRGADKIKQFLSDKQAKHVIARAATFKLIQEDEDVVKKGEFIRVDKLPPQVLQKFSQDFMEGKVSEKLKTADKDYKLAAHNSTFLAELTFDLLKKKEAPEDPEKVLWLLADYLVDEIGTSKEENINREVLEEIKKKLLSMWKNDTGKKRVAEDVEKTYAVINTALKLKGLLSIYKRHGKALEKAAAKIKKILKSLPADSQLYRKTADNLKQIGFFTINEDFFK